MTGLDLAVAAVLLVLGVAFWRWCRRIVRRTTPRPLWEQDREYRQRDSFVATHRVDPKWRK